MYLKYRFENAKMDWGNHTIGWARNSIESNCSIVVVKYEELLQSPEKIFGDALRQKYGATYKELMSEAISQNQFARQRNRPDEQHRTYLRKGNSGDWTIYFSRESDKLFDDMAGEALIELGYEDNHSWVDNF